MGIYTINLPDVGEGVAEAELTEWAVAVGDQVQEDDILAVVMTDKVSVEIPTPVNGQVVWLGGAPGDEIAIGSKFAQIEVEGEVDEPQPLQDSPAVETQPAADTRPAPEVQPAPPAPDQRGKTLAAPAVRKRARDAGVALSDITGTGPEGRVTQADLAAYLLDQETLTSTPEPGSTDVKIIGLRKKIAEKMALSKSRIPHITIVEEIDVTDLQELRSKLNDLHAEKRGKLTILPFIMRAIVSAVADQPQMNARFDDQANVLRQYEAAHIGIATQTEAGLTVPVVKDAQALTVWQAAAEISRLAEAVRSGSAGTDDLSGSTITITSLGSMGAIATTPIINHPEVAIVGVNKMMMRPVWDGEAFQPRLMMNLSCAFDHRVIDGWDAAVFVQRLKALLEDPVMMIVGA